MITAVIQKGGSGGYKPSENGLDRLLDEHTILQKEEITMNDMIRCGQIYQILALNEEMYKNGHVSREEHDFVQRLQAKKLTNLHGRDTIGALKNDLT